MNRLTRALTKKGIALSWILAMGLLLYAGITSLFFQTMMPDQYLSAILLFFAWAMFWLESVWEGSKFKLSFDRAGDIIGFGMGFFALIAGIGILFSNVVIMNVLGPYIGEIFIVAFIILLWEGMKNVT